MALPNGHILAKARELKIEQLPGEAFIMPLLEVAPTLRNTIVEHYHAGGFEPDIRIEVQLQKTILNLVNEGIGIALVPDSMHKAQLANVAFRR